MTGAEGTLLAIAAGNAYVRDARGRFRRVSSRPTISRSNVLTYASTLAVIDVVSVRSIAPITCSGSLALDLAAVGGRQVDEVVRLEKLLVAGALRVAPDRAAQPRPRRQVHAHAKPRRRRSSLPRGRCDRSAGQVRGAHRRAADSDPGTRPRHVWCLWSNAGAVAVPLRSADFVGPGSPVTANRIAAREVLRHVGANRPPPPGA